MSKQKIMNMTDNPYYLCSVEFGSAQAFQCYIHPRSFRRICERFLSLGCTVIILEIIKLDTCKPYIDCRSRFSLIQRCKYIKDNIDLPF